MSLRLIFLPMCLLSISFAEDTNVIEGILLGYSGGNQIGVYRLQVDNRVVLIERTSNTKSDESVFRFRYRVGSLMRIHAQRVQPESSELPDMRADYEMILRPPQAEWREVGEEIDQFLRVLTSTGSEAVLARWQLDKESIEALRAVRPKKMEARMRGVEAWAVVRRTQHVFEARLCDVFFQAGVGLRLTLGKDQGKMRIVRVQLTDPWTYYDLFAPNSN